MAEREPQALLVRHREPELLDQTSRATVEMFKKHGFDVVCRETDEARTWTKWRAYLIEFAPQLFQ